MAMLIPSPAKAQGKGRARSRPAAQQISYFSRKSGHAATCEKDQMGEHDGTSSEAGWIDRLGQTPGEHGGKKHRGKLCVLGLGDACGAPRTHGRIGWRCVLGVSGIPPKVDSSQVVRDVFRQDPIFGFSELAWD